MKIPSLFVAAVGVLCLALQSPAQSAPPNNASKLAALEKACAAGALTQDECAQRRAALRAQPQAASPSAAASANSAYRDPQGRYSLTVPTGWTTSLQADSGTLELSSGPSWAMLLAGGGTVPSDVNHQITEQIKAQFKDFQMLNEGDTQIHGHPAHGTTATGINPKGERVSVLVLSINAGSGHFLTVLSSTPNDQAKTINTTVVQMAQSLRFAGE